jgi:hypothetical protein
MGFVENLVQRLPGSWGLQDGKALAFGHTPAANLPTCDASRANEHRFIRGGAGVADRTVVCEMNASGVSAWRDKGHAYLEAEYAGGGGGGGGSSSLTDILLLGGM